MATQLPMGTLAAVCVVHAVKPDAGRVGRTAIDKRPVDGPVQVEPLGLFGDTQCSTEHHGGPEKALYAYAREEAARWAAELGRDIPPGFFGENLATTGVATSDAIVGELWRIGDTVRVRVAKARTPCATFGRRMAEPRWVRRFAERGDCGAYLAVETPGSIQAGDAVTIVHRPSHGLRVRDLFAAKMGTVIDPEPLRAALSAPEKLSISVVETLQRALESH